MLLKTKGITEIEIRMCCFQYFKTLLFVKNFVTPNTGPFIPFKKVTKNKFV